MAVLVLVLVLVHLITFYMFVKLIDSPSQEQRMWGMLSGYTTFFTGIGALVLAVGSSFGLF